MREDLRPYWVKKCYLKLRHWYTEYYLRPECESLGPHHTVMKPWYVQISGNNIRIGRCFTAIGEPGNRVELGVWGREEGQGRIEIGDCVLMSPGSRLHRALSFALENSGPLFRWSQSLKGPPLLWFEKWLSYITGAKFSSGHLQEIGARIFNLERMYNLREGVTGEQDTLPPRILNEPTFEGMTSGHPLDQLLPRYYKIRGWDAHGVPTQKTLDRLGVRI